MVAQKQQISELFESFGYETKTQRMAEGKSMLQIMTPDTVPPQSNYFFFDTKGDLLNGK